METIKRSVVSDGHSGRDVKSKSTKDSQGSENTLHDTIMMNICHYTFV